MSDLHKKNLEALRQAPSDTSLSTTSYRDRAKERRDRFGSDKDVSKNTLKVWIFNFTFKIFAKKGKNNA